MERTEIVMPARPHKDIADSPVTDEQLVAASRDGDTRAFRQLVDRHERRVAATVYGMLGNCPEADDVGQEVFIGFYKNLKSFRGESSVGTYLTRIAINMSLNELKRRKRRGKLFQHQSDDLPVDHPDTSISPTAFEDKELVTWALEQLSPEFKSVVVLRMVQGHSTAETAELLKIPLGTAQSRLARGLARMREILKPHVGGAQ